MRIHTCPVYGCPRVVKDDKLMCLDHWRMVPSELRDRVYRLWWMDPSGVEHKTAILEATRAVNEKLGKKTL